MGVQSLCVGYISKKEKKRQVLRRVMVPNSLLHMDILVGIQGQGRSPGVSFMEDSIRHELGFGEVNKAQRTETHINGGMLQH